MDLRSLAGRRASCQPCAGTLLAKVRGPRNASSDVFAFLPAPDAPTRALTASRCAPVHATSDVRDLGATRLCRANYLIPRNVRCSHVLGVNLFLQRAPFRVGGVWHCHPTRLLYRVWMLSYCPRFYSNVHLVILLLISPVRYLIAQWSNQFLCSPYCL